MELPWSQDARLARLLHRSREGDREAFRALYRELYPRVLAFAMRRCARPADAEDVVGRTFLKLLERLAQWDQGRGGVMAWTISIARNLIVDDSMVHNRIVGLDEQALVAQGTPHSVLEERQELEALGVRLETLAPELREMFELRYADGLTYRQIGDLFGLSEAAVKQRFSRALRELKQEATA